MHNKYVIINIIALLILIAIPLSAICADNVYEAKAVVEALYSEQDKNASEILKHNADAISVASCEDGLKLLTHMNIAHLSIHEEAIAVNSPNILNCVLKVNGIQLPIALFKI